ncbi:hypothetical protein D3OALGA1CA_3775 [Olavius algarvensis associated proteobacterium Delta 3]|nr:hypothetical protein D3OALGA1CA_3775 [Olavius algarvensis associated proteobacterium Delta 3]CAB5149822.1 hypothetical protein D3OALGB2SA_4734 [Olavius algarvensis associated proteobacterium Delta 3]
MPDRFSTFSFIFCSELYLPMPLPDVVHSPFQLFNPLHLSVDFFRVGGFTADHFGKLPPLKVQFIFQILVLAIPVRISLFVETGPAQKRSWSWPCPRLSPMLPPGCL